MTCKNYSKKIEHIGHRRYKKVTHCIFDLDGTLLNSEIIYHNTIRELCESFGRTYGRELQVKLYGVTDKQICVQVCKELKLPISPDEFERRMGDLLKKTLPSAPLQKGAERLLTHLYDYDVPMAIATNSTEQAVRLHATARPKLFGMFHHIVSATDPEVDRGKPHPDIFFVAAKRFPEKPKPHKCLVFEDSPVGVEAAREAGMQVVMIPDPRLNRDLTRRASLVIRSLMDFHPELFGLPSFEDTPAAQKKLLDPRDDDEEPVRVPSNFEPDLSKLNPQNVIKLKQEDFEKLRKELKHKPSKHSKHKPPATHS